MRIYNLIISCSVLVLVVSCENLMNSNNRFVAEKETGTTKVDNHDDIQNKDDNSMNYLLYLSLGLNGLVILYLARMGISKRLQSDTRLNKKVCNYDSNETNSFNSLELDKIRSRIKNIEDKINLSKLSNREECVPSRKIVLVESMDNNPMPKLNNVQQVNSEVILYAGPVNRNNLTFSTVASRPEQGITIYELRATDDRATFEVFKGAHKKVLTDTNFLECACEFKISGRSKSRITTIEAGNTEKQPNGSWKITKKTTIKFES